MRGVAKRRENMAKKHGIPVSDIYWRKMVSRFVDSAKRVGYLPNAKDYLCADCGKRAHHWEHRDYTRPLDVQPTCTKCNFARGPGIVSPFPSWKKALKL